MTLCGHLAVLFFLKEVFILADALLQSVMHFFSNILPPQLTVFIISLMPILEMRLGMVAARLLELPMWEAFFVCLAGTMLPVPFILIFIKKVFEWMKKKGGSMGKMVAWLEKKAETGGKKVQRIKTGGLIIFTAIPLPGSGAWTAALAASFLELSFRTSMWSIFVGAIITDFIMLGITYGIF